MFKIKTAFMIIVVILFNIFSETKTNEQVSVPRLYLKYQSDGMSYNVQTGIQIIRHPYYSFDQYYIDEKVKYFGQNIAKEMEPVPEAKQLMNGYMIHGIGVITCVVTGVGLFVISGVNAIQKGSEKKPDGTYDTKVPSGIPIGLGVFGLGLVLNITKPFYLHAAVYEYNKHARN